MKRKKLIEEVKREIKFFNWRFGEFYEIRAEKDAQYCMGKLDALRWMLTELEDEEK